MKQVCTRLPLPQEERQASMGMGRRKLWNDRLILRIAAGFRQRIDSVLMPNENRSTLIRRAVEAEVKRREARAKTARKKVRSADLSAPPVLTALSSI